MSIISRILTAVQVKNSLVVDLRPSQSEETILQEVDQFIEQYRNSSSIQQKGGIPVAFRISDERYVEGRLFDTRANRTVISGVAFLRGLRGFNKITVQFHLGSHITKEFNGLNGETYYYSYSSDNYSI